MSKETNSIVCSHGKGLACPICYNQCLSIDFSKFDTVNNAQMEAYKQLHLTGTAFISVDPATNTPTVVVYKHPFLNTDSLD